MSLGYSALLTVNSHYSFGASQHVGRVHTESGCLAGALFVASAVLLYFIYTKVGSTVSPGDHPVTNACLAENL